MLIREHEEEIENDLHRYHGLTLRAYWDEQISPRLLMVYIEQLPPESSLKRKLVKGTAAEWTIDQHFMASISDLLAVGNWQRQGKRHAQKPKPVPRPGKEKTVRKYGSVEGLDQEKVIAFLDARKPQAEESEEAEPV